MEQDKKVDWAALSSLTKHQLIELLWNDWDFVMNEFLNDFRVYFTREMSKRKKIDIIKTALEQCDISVDDIEEI